MCIFSPPVEFVADTKIFARGSAGAEQLLAYSMRVGASEDLAMLLPIPTPPGSSEDAVTFVDMSAYPRFFADLYSAFPGMFPLQSLMGGAEVPAEAPASLRVHRVGDFEASFVPTLADFARLDPRFRLPADVWAQLPQYSDWGFAVFKLRTGAAGLASTHEYHPMAFRFPRRDPSMVFFPTVHIHDGAVHETATFAHELYLQHEGGHPGTD